MKKIVLLQVLSLLFSCQAPESLNKYETDTFSIYYPPNLEIEKNDQSGVLFLLKAEQENENDIFIENINLVSGMAGNIRLEEYAKNAIDEIKVLANLIENKIITVNGKDCLRFVFELEENDTKLKFIQHHYLYNNKAYTLTFSSEAKSYDKYFDEMNKVLYSFRLK